MNLCNGKSGDWDILAKNTNMIIGDTDEDWGLDLTLFFGTFGEAIIPVEVQIGKVPKYVVIPFHQFLLKVKGDLLIPTEEQMLADISMPIKLPKLTQELFQITMPLRLVCDETLLTIRMPIRMFYYLQNPLKQNLLEIKMPLRLQGLNQSLFSIHVPIKSVKRRTQYFKRLKKHLEELN